MSNQILRYVGNSFSEYLHSIADAFGVALTDNTVKIPPSTGAGFIKYIELEEGFGIRYYDFILKKDFEFNLFYDDDKELIYRVLYILKDDFNSITDSRDFIIMYTSEVQVKGLIKKGEHFYRLAIIFNAVWLENNYQEANTRIGQLAESFIKKNIPVIISKEFDSKSYVMAIQLATGLTNNVLPQIQIKMMCIILVNEFLNKIVEHGSPKIFSDQSVHYDMILEVEKKIGACLKTSLPPLQELATEFNLSTSTLKRHFKIVFGKTLFEYYQEKRMHWAKSQIEEGHKTITEIAYELRFAKVNNFSAAFRKQFHFLPRDLKFRKIVL